MALQLDPTSNEFAYISSGLGLSLPFTWACWINADVDNANLVALSMADFSSSVYWALFASGNIANDPIRISCNSAIAATAPGGFVAGSWIHACFVARAADDRSVYADGGNEGTDNTSRTPPGWNRFCVGVSADVSPFGYFDGAIAWVTVWDTNLTALNVSDLADGEDPQTIAVGNLVACWPLINNLNDTINGFHLTHTGTPTYVLGPDIPEVSSSSSSSPSSPSSSSSYSSSSPSSPSSSSPSSSSSSSSSSSISFSSAVIEVPRASAVSQIAGDPSVVATEKVT